MVMSINKGDVLAVKAGFKLSILALAMVSVTYSFAAEAEDNSGPVTPVAKPVNPKPANPKTTNLSTIGETEFLEVVGQSAQIDKALKEQRASDSIESVVHADAIGQLPDDNAAEADRKSVV